MRMIVSIICLFTIIPVALPQDLKKITKMNENGPFNEEYFVLKEDQAVKHGKYIKWYERIMLEKYVREFGNYDHDQKSGVWFYFNVAHPQNPMNIVGEYSDGEKNGQWFYFYTPEIKDTSLMSILGFKKLTKVIEPKRRDQAFQLTIDTTGIKLAATGNYKNNRKVGKWSYFSKDGQLVREFDFAENKVINGPQDDSLSFYLLGGFTHFQEQLNLILMEFIGIINKFPSSEAKFEVITNSNNLYVNNLTTPLGDPFSGFLAYQLKNMPLEWIDYDPVFENFSFIFDLTLTTRDKSPNVTIGTPKPKFRH